jgi:hypothetical protein
MDKYLERLERFAVLRAAYPSEDAESILTRIHDEEIEAAEREHYRALAERDEACAEAFMQRASDAGNL